MIAKDLDRVLAMGCLFSHRFKRQKPPQMYYGREVNAIPVHPVKPWSSTVVAAHTGPNAGLTRLDMESTTPPAVDVADCKNWNCPTEFAYGVALSLYEEDRTQMVMQEVNGASVQVPMIIGEPVADVFGVLVRENNAILAIADGVNWGNKSRLAARCGVHAVMEHISKNIAQIQLNPNTHTVSQLLLESVTVKAQELILKKNATLTTLSAAVVCEMETPGEWGLFVVAVGDSPVYIYCPHSKKVIEITVGCHAHDGDRDMRMAGGVLGPSFGSQPDLDNLTVAYTPVYPGDVVFCVSDGVSDNFSGKVMNPSADGLQDSKTRICNCCSTNPSQLKLKPCCENVAHLTSVLSNHQEKLSHHLSAQTVAACLINHSVETTEQKRLFRSDCIENKVDIRAEIRTNPEFAAQFKLSPGKLDHASVVAYQVGYYKS